MTFDQLHKANNLKAQIEEKRLQIKSFENGTVKSLIMRNFNEEDCTYTDVEVTKCIPRAKFKLMMLDVLKSELASLEHRFEFLFVQMPEKLETGTNGI